MVVFARLFPHMSYDGLTISLQQDCQFFQFGTPSVAPLFAPLEEALIKDFKIILLGISRYEVTESLRNCVTLGSHTLPRPHPQTERRQKTAVRYSLSHFSTYRHWISVHMPLR